MDLADENLATIGSLCLHNMTVDELVEADSQVESRFHFWKGVWWREVKPFFYHPASFTTQVIPNQATPKPWLALGGYYHLVPEGASSNGFVVVNEVSDLAAYDLDRLKSNKRSQIRRALSVLRIRRVTNPDELLSDGYRIYLDWENRTSGVRVRRSNDAIFRRWITRILHHPYKLLLGAYLESRLIAFVISQAVEGVAELPKTFSDSSFNRYAPSSVLIYAYLKIAGQNPEICKACDGLRSLKTSLERYKNELGFRHVSYPTFISLRAGIRPLISWCMPNEYRRLTGHYVDEQCDEV